MGDDPVQRQLLNDERDHDAGSEQPRRVRPESLRLIEQERSDQRHAHRQRQCVPRRIVRDVRVGRDRGQDDRRADDADDKRAEDYQAASTPFDAAAATSASTAAPAATITTAVAPVAIVAGGTVGSPGQPSQPTIPERK